MTADNLLLLQTLNWLWFYLILLIIDFEFQECGLVVYVIMLEPITNLVQMQAS